MKIKWCLILLLILLPDFLLAQSKNNNGVKFGYTSSGIYGTYTENTFFSTSRRNSYHVALFIEYCNYSFFSLVSQIEYAQKGFIEKQVETNESGQFIQNVKAKTRLDYFSIPLLVKIKYSKIKLNPYIIFGPRFDYLVNKKKGIFKFTEIDFESQFAEYLNLNKTVFGGSIGIGFSLPRISLLKSFLEFRYNHDFTDSFFIIKENTVKNKSFDLWLGISF